MQNEKIKIGILGATGSIGRQTLDVINNNPELFSVELLSANNNKALFEEVLSKFSPKTAVANNSFTELYSVNNYHDTSVLSDPNIYNDCDIVINGIGGTAGILPSIAILDGKPNLASANKESIVSAWNILKKHANLHNKKIIPVDSEHSAIYQCIDNGTKPSKLILTASGGAFRNKTKQELYNATSKEALNHPTWNMGKKVTIDSATLFNKTLEVIEAKNLFGISNIDVIIHKESYIHSMIEYIDGTIKACISYPDMRLPIQYAITNGKRIKSNVEQVDFTQLLSFSFAMPDYDRFPCLSIKDNISSDETASIACGADEIAVELYLQNKIGFYDIYELIKDALTSIKPKKTDNVFDILSLVEETKEYTLNKAIRRQN